MYQTLVSVPTLAAHLHDPNWLVFDCRFSLADTELGLFMYEGNHISGAYYLHLDDDLSSPITPNSGRHPLPDPDKLAAKLAACGLNQNTQVVVYDDNFGATACRAWWLLRWLGHTAVALLDGGMEAWRKANGATDSEEPAARHGHFRAQLQPDFVIETPQLTQSHHWQLVDARSRERFSGEKELIDPVAGHIAGSLNRPLTDNIEGIYFKSAEQLRQEWQSVLGSQTSSQIVHVCGSGVTACHNQLAMEIAGLQGSKLYAGSWSEWIRDPQRPVATGLM